MKSKRGMMPWLYLLAVYSRWAFFEHQLKGFTWSRTYSGQSSKPVSTDNMTPVGIVLFKVHSVHDSTCYFDLMTLQTDIRMVYRWLLMSSLLHLLFITKQALWQYSCTCAGFKTFRLASPFLCFLSTSRLGAGNNQRCWSNLNTNPIPRLESLTIGFLNLHLWLLLHRSE